MVKTNQYFEARSTNVRASEVRLRPQQITREATVAGESRAQNLANYSIELHRHSIAKRHCYQYCWYVMRSSILVSYLPITNEI